VPVCPSWELAQAYDINRDTVLDHTVRAGLPGRRTPRLDHFQVAPMTSPN